MRPAFAKRNRPRPLAVTVFGAVDRPAVALTSEGLLNRRLCGLRVADQGRRPNLNESSGTDASKDPRAEPDTGGGAILLTWEFLVGSRRSSMLAWLKSACGPSKELLVSARVRVTSTVSLRSQSQLDYRTGNRG